jgi:hypothetical protein
MLQDGDARSTTQFNCEFAQSPEDISMMYEWQSKGL